MKILKLIVCFLLTAMCFVETAHAQFRGIRRGTFDGTSEQTKSRQRRFVTPVNDTVSRQPVHPSGGQPVSSTVPKNSVRTDRMTREERRALRKQINDANQGIYKKNRNTTQTLP